MIRPQMEELVCSSFEGHMVAKVLVAPKFLLGWLSLDLPRGLLSVAVSFWPFWHLHRYASSRDGIESLADPFGLNLQRRDRVY